MGAINSIRVFIRCQLFTITETAMDFAITELLATCYTDQDRDAASRYFQDQIYIPLDNSYKD